MLLILVRFYEVNCCVYSCLKLTVEAVLWVIFSINFVIAFGSVTKKSTGTGGDRCEVCGDRWDWD